MKLFNKIKQDLLEEIIKLSQKHKLSLWEKIKKEDSIVHLNSKLTEAYFGLFFDKTCSQLKYNHKVFMGSDKTPDWIITKNGQDIILEVCRLNPAKEDQERQEAMDAAIEEFRKNNPGILVIGGSHSITIKPEKLYGENGSLSCKAKRYGPLVDTANRPFIICVYFDSVSGHDALDLYDCLYGHLGLYYTNEQMKKNVSGVFLRNNSNDYIYFHNFSLQNRLNNDNINWLCALQYKE